MPQSETDICNLALAHLGEAPIQSMNEDSAASRACLLHYAQARDELLRSHRWNFAQTRATLSLLAEVPAFTWSKQYELPADCLRVLEVNDQELGDEISQSWIIEGRRILTDETTMHVVYVRRVEDVSQFDSLFIGLLALRLAISLTESIRGTTGKTAELTTAYNAMVAPLARRVDANEGRRRKGILPLNSMAIRARGGFDNSLWPYSPPAYP